MRILHAVYDPHAAVVCMRPYSLACSLPNNLCVIDTKDIDACG
jgi:hypothetical protein